jgi:hypothetical protein
MSITSGANSSRSQWATREWPLEAEPRTAERSWRAERLVQALSDACLRTISIRSRRDPTPASRGERPREMSVARQLHSSRSAGPTADNLIMEHEEFIQRIRQSASIAGELEDAEPADMLNQHGGRPCSAGDCSRGHHEAVSPCR